MLRYTEKLPTGIRCVRHQPQRCPEQWEGFFTEFIPSTPLRAGLSGGKILGPDSLGPRMTKEKGLVMTSPCHCESDEVSRSNLGGGNRDCHALLAMTKEKGLRIVSSLGGACPRPSCDLPCASRGRPLWIE